MAVLVATLDHLHCLRCGRASSGERRLREGERTETSWRVKVICCWRLYSTLYLVLCLQSLGPWIHYPHPLIAQFTSFCVQTTTNAFFIGHTPPGPCTPGKIGFKFTYWFSFFFFYCHTLIHIKSKFLKIHSLFSHFS